MSKASPKGEMACKISVSHRSFAEDRLFRDINVVMSGK
jgi:hypothetical protein